MIARHYIAVSIHLFDFCQDPKTKIKVTPQTMSIIVAAVSLIIRIPIILKAIPIGV
jgi:hypothetical protein